MKKPELLTVSEAAEVLGVRQNRVRFFVYSGRLAAHRHGPIWLIARVDLERFSRLPRTVGRPKTG